MVAAGLAVVLVLGSVAVALFAPADRATALASGIASIASTAAAVAAAWLGREALRRTDDQLAETRRSIQLSRYPLVLPRHQPVGQPDEGQQLTHHPPADDRYVLKPTAGGGFAFLLLPQNRYLLPLENVGEGPALRVSGTLHRSDGYAGALVGIDALGAGRTGFCVATLTQVSERGSQLPLTNEQHHRNHEIVLSLDLDYEDVFGTSRHLSAVFIAAGVGRWNITDGSRAESRR